MTNSGQLRLNLTPCLSYSAKNFIAHSGVGAQLNQITAMLETDPPRFCFVHGDARWGKTHFGIALADKLVNLGLRPVFIEGLELANIVAHGAHRFMERETIIVDDAHLFFSEIQAGQSGPVVKFFEELRVKAIGLVLISSKHIEEFPCDEHIVSRLKGCAAFEIGMPEPTQLQSVMDSMAKQRGMALNGRKLKFVENRLQRSVPDVERYLTRLQHLSEIVGKKVSFRTLGDALKPLRPFVF